MGLLSFWILQLWVWDVYGSHLLELRKKWAHEGFFVKLSSKSILYNVTKLKPWFELKLYIIFSFNLSIFIVDFWFLQNVDVTKQEEVDKLMLELDGTDNKSKWIKNVFMLHNTITLGTSVNFWTLVTVFYFILFLANVWYCKTLVSDDNTCCHSSAELVVQMNWIVF